jgi:ATPase subunit of ABC transporter with duplicated ATPase domains
MIISHDRWFLDRVATHMLAFEGESHVEWFEGNYQDYEADKKRPSASTPTSPTASNTNASRGRDLPAEGSKIAWRNHEARDESKWILGFFDMRSKAGSQPPSPFQLAQVHDQQQ